MAEHDERRDVKRLFRCDCGAERIFSAGLTEAEARACMRREGWVPSGEFFFTCPQCGAWVPGG